MITAKDVTDLTERMMKDLSECRERITELERACAVKDEALQQAKYLAAHGIGMHGGSGAGKENEERNIREVRRILDLIESALSPAAGKDYVPVEKLVEELDKMPDWERMHDEVKRDLENLSLRYIDLRLGDFQGAVKAKEEALEKVKSLEQQLQEARGGWIKCSERMPEENVLVLLFNGEQRYQTVAKYMGDLDGEHVWNGQDAYEITHWMKLPEPPEPSPAPSTPPTEGKDL